MSRDEAPTRADAPVGQARRSLRLVKNEPPQLACGSAADDEPRELIRKLTRPTPSTRRARADSDDELPPAA